MTAATPGIADGRALGGLLRVVVTRPSRLSFAKAAVDLFMEQMDAAASRFRADSELSHINASPEREVRASPLLGRAISEALRGARLTGGAIAVAGEAPPGGWRIQVSEDSGAAISHDEETISITDGGVATSSTSVRRWTRGGVVLHHIIDPSTGLPAAGPWRTATVVAGSCVDANIASTAAIVMGDAATGWLDVNLLPARLVGRDGAVHRTARWPVP